MKKILALLMAVVMLLSLAACKSDGGEDEKELSKEEKFLEELEDLFDDIYKAEEKGDQEKVEKLYEDLEAMEEEYEKLYEELKEEDEDKAEKFDEETKKIAEEFYEKLEELGPSDVVDVERPEHTELPDEDFEEIVVVDNDECIVKITDLEYDEYMGYQIKTYLENKSSDKTYEYTVHDASVNGVMTSAYLYAEVAAGKKAKENISLYDELDIGDYTDIELSIAVTDVEDWGAEPVAYETIHIYPYGEDKASTYVRESKSTDVVLMDNAYVTIIATDFVWDDNWGYTVEYYVVNKTDVNIGIDSSDCYVNDFGMETYWGASVNAGKCTFSSMNFYPEALEENDIASEADIKTIELELRVYDSDDWEADAFVDTTITISF